METRGHSIQSKLPFKSTSAKYGTSSWNILRAPQRLAAARLFRVALRGLILAKVTSIMKRISLDVAGSVGNPAVTAECVCGAVRIEIDFPARCAWHDHSIATQRAQGAAYATYVACWRSRCRVTKGKTKISCFKDKAARTQRSFCTRCGTPLFYERDRSAQTINIPRALFTMRTGRQARYHIGCEQTPEWAYRGEPLVALRGFPGVLYDRSRRKRRAALWPGP
jgi:hypothetical protein